MNENELEEAKLAVADLERLLDGVLSDRAEAIKEGWPDAREKYDGLEMQIRDQLAKARNLVRQIEFGG